MREIEFRGKPLEYKKEWVYGNGFVIDNATVGYPVYVWENEPFSQLFKVVPETVGQYTGLKDKNGVKIFEGDIISVVDTLGRESRELIDSVAFENGVFSLMAFNAPVAFILQDGWCLKVIGNIHDNPELLEVV
jgi:uncharacterized phage protein (TIGR01671 family)